MDLVIGRVVKSHGVRGELVVDVRTDQPELRFAPGTQLRGRMPKSKSDNTFEVTAARDHSGRLLLSLDGVSGRDSADALRGMLFLIDAADVDSGDDPDAFYDHELEGLPVRTVDGNDVGAVVEVLHLPGSDVLSVKSAAGQEILIPFVREIVPTVTADGIVVDPPDGLLDPESQ